MESFSLAVVGSISVYAAAMGIIYILEGCPEDFLTCHSVM